MLAIGFSTSRAWYSRLIRKFTKSKVSHTFLLTNVHGNLLVFQEGPLGYSVRAYEGFHKENQVVSLVCPKVSILKGFQKSLAELGQPYAYLALLGFGLVLLLRHFGWRLTHNPFSSKRATFCSQRNTEILQDSGYPGAEALNPALTSPEMLLEFLSKTPL
jgi:hypothetical protein